MLCKRLPSHHGDGKSATCEEREQTESCHWWRMEEPAADKMAMLQRTKVTCGRGQRTAPSSVSAARACAPLAPAPQTLCSLYWS